MTDVLTADPLAVVFTPVAFRQAWESWKLRNASPMGSPSGVLTLKAEVATVFRLDNRRSLSL
jgi:hypothetical protein